MTRISVGGVWFDADKAEKFLENRTHDGSNFISDATGSQWEHESIYRTAKGKWVLCRWSDWQGSRTRYEVIDANQACAWLIAQGHQSDATGQNATEARANGRREGWKRMKLAGAMIDVCGPCADGMIPKKTINDDDGEAQLHQMQAAAGKD